MGNINIYSLREISEWQLSSENNDVALPPLQRNFVWKPRQMETVWDSILRGYPLGSFLLSENEQNTLFLMDGQQRSTSIALGYHNPWTNEKTHFWSVKDMPVIWVDLKSWRSDRNPTDQLYSVRVLTSSHPWGYQQKENGKTLSLKDRKTAWNLFQSFEENKDKTYVHFEKTSVFPWDAELPVPLPFLLEAFHSEPNEKWYEQLISRCDELLHSEHITTKHLQDDYITELTNFLSSSENREAFDYAQRNVLEAKIPGIIVENEVIQSNEDSYDGQNPTLFVRLNSAGTTLNGEELIYSIYKATFEGTKKLVESIGSGFLKPSAIISIVSRLAWSELHDNGYVRPMTVREFRQRIRDDNFRSALGEWIDTGTSPSNVTKGTRAGIAFEYINNILCNNDDRDSLPAVLAKDILRHHPDLVMLMIRYAQIRNFQLSDSEEKKLRGLVTSIAWFSSDSAKVCKDLWPSLNSDFNWERNTLIELIWKDGVDAEMPPILKPDFLRKILTDMVISSEVSWNDLYPVNSNELFEYYRNYFNRQYENSETNDDFNKIWDRFIIKLYYNKGMLLYAQRAYIRREFSEFNQFESLTDTNTPWDWDHIYPNSWVKRKHGIDPRTRSWNNCIGNYRALSMSENRSIQDQSPQTRLNGPDEDSFIHKEDYQYWKDLSKRINEGDNELINKHLNAVLIRFINIYSEWYNTMEIDTLF